MSNCHERLSKYVDEIEKGLAYYMPNISIAQARLFDAMEYSLMAGGKRIRPAMLLEFCRVSGGNLPDAMPFACAIEMIHTYSLVHDDLPGMDDDDIRRGRPTNHKVFGESTAILAGDALLTSAFEIMLAPEYTGSLPPERVIAAAHSIAWAAGPYGMCGGQLLDMDFMDEREEAVVHIHRLKTGALFSSAAEAGCILAGADDGRRSAAVEFANNVGLAFQLRDDMLNADGDSSVMGKATGTDVINGKLTMLRLLGAEKCGRLIEELTEKAKKAVSVFPDSEFLVWMADMLSKREY